MRRSRLRRALRRYTPKSAGLGIIAAVAGLGLAAWGLLAARPPAESAQGVAATAAAGAPSAVRAPGDSIVSPGSLTLDQDAPQTRDAPDDRALCPGCDVLIVTVCSLRRDHVGAYGLSDIETPAMDRIAAEGWRFDRVYSASNFTLASLTAILTGRFGSTTGVTGWDKGLVDDVPTLPEIFGLYGYATGGFTVDAPSGFRPDYGLHRGFQHMAIYPPPLDTPDGRRSGTDPGYRGGWTAKPAAQWILDSDPERPLFTMLHTRTAHFPFVITDVGADDDPTGVTRALFDAGGGSASAGPKPGDVGGTVQQGVVTFVNGVDPTQAVVRAAGDAGVEVWRQRYTEAVERTDDDLAVLWEALERSGRLEHTIILMVADHGESLDEHSELLHGDAYYEGVVRVPMLLRVPGLAPGHTDALVSQVDIAPTLLALVGAVPPADIDGHSAVPLLTGEATQIRGTALVEGGVARQKSTIPRGAVIAPPWTLLRQDQGCGDGLMTARAPGEPASCLFDVDADPQQTVNRASAHPDVVSGLLARWDDFREARGGEARQLELDPDFVEQLHKTGYDFEPLK